MLYLFITFFLLFLYTMVYIALYHGKIVFTSKTLKQMKLIMTRALLQDVTIEKWNGATMVKKIALDI